MGLRDRLSEFVRYVKSYQYTGLRYTCNFCNGRFRNLLPMGLDHPAAKNLVGGGYRRALCPRCRSFDRERLLYHYLLKRTDVFSPTPRHRVLHIAPEKMLQRILKPAALEYVSADRDSPLADVRMDVTDIPFADGHFDLILCNHVLEHVPDDLKAMRELFRVLKRGGLAILQVPISRDEDSTREDPSITAPEERERLFGQADHVRAYGGKDYRMRLERAGFHVELFGIESDPDAALWARHGMNREEVLHIGRKVAPQA